MKKYLSIFTLAFILSFSAVINVAHATPAHDIPNALRWYAYAINGIYRDYDYTPPPGGFVNGDETEYNAITWNENALQYPKPEWFIISSNDEVISNFTAKYLYTFDNFATVKTEVDSLPNAGSLTTSFAAKVDKTTTVNGQTLSGNVTVTTISGNAATSTALAANGNNCSSGQYARGVDAGGNAEGCTATSAGTYTVGSPNSRTMALATAYQCTDNSKPCSFTVSVSCPYTLSLLAGATCGGEVRIGSANTVASGASGTAIAPVQRSASGILGLATNDYETKTIDLPAGWYIAVRQTTGSGMTIPAAYDQSLSVQ